MKKILHIVQGGVGGTSEYLKLLIPRLDKTEYDNTVICHGEIYDQLKGMNIKVHRIDMSRNISPISDLKSLISISKYLRQNHVDLIHAHSSKAGFLGRAAARLHRIPCVYNPHGWSFDIKTSKVKTKLYEVIERLAARWTDKIILISPAELDSALNRKISFKSKFIVINNGIDTAKYSQNVDYEFKKQLGLKENEKLIGMCGRLVPQKAPENFIEIAKYVCDRNSNCKFILVGDGTLMDSVKCKIESLNLEEKVLLTDWTDTPEKYINIFDIGVLTSQWEGFGLVLAEYMACGKPVVASRVGGIPYVVRDGEDGFLCAPDDIASFGECILRLLSDNSLYNNISRNSRKRVIDEFNIDRVANQHQQLYSQLLK